MSSGAPVTPGTDILPKVVAHARRGVASVRGVLGAGMNRMNVYTVRRATQGLADYLSDGEKKRGVVIASGLMAGGALGGVLGAALRLIPSYSEEWVKTPFYDPLRLRTHPLEERTA